MGDEERVGRVEDRAVERVDGGEPSRFSSAFRGGGGGGGGGRGSGIVLGEGDGEERR